MKAELVTCMGERIVDRVEILYSAVGKFAADARSRPAGVAIYFKGLETKQVR